MIALYPGGLCFNPELYHTKNVVVMLHSLPLGIHRTRICMDSLSFRTAFKKRNGIHVELVMEVINIDEDNLLRNQL